MLNNKKFVAISIVLSAAILFIQADRRFGYTSKTEKENVNIISDGTGYYAYLPQYIIHSSQKNFQFLDSINQKYPDKQFSSMLLKDEKLNGYYNKFYIGTAIAQAPFFLIAHSFCKLSGKDADGYALVYRFWLTLCGIFYWILASIALIKLFRRLGFNEAYIVLGLFLILFGTNLNYYVAYYTSYSHIYSFAAIAWFINIAHLWTFQHDRKKLMLLAFLVALIAIIRPVNVLVVLMLPFLFTSWKNFANRLEELIKRHKLDLIAAILIFSVLIFVQLLVNYDQTGSWQLYTYAGEGFDNLFTPQFFNVLFSYEKGLFVYAPLLLLVPLGIYFMKQQFNRFQIFGWSLTVIVTLYFVSSWWSWTYGGGLGMRPLIEFFPLYLFPILSLIAAAKPLVRTLVFVISCVGIFLYQTYQIQYNKNIISYEGMNKERFWEIFLKTDARYGWMFEYDYDKLPSNPGEPLIQLQYSNNSWKILNDQHDDAFKVSLENEKIILTSDSLMPNYARLQGKVAVHDPANNPTLNTEYYIENERIHLHPQPFGNKIHQVGKLCPVTIDVELNKFKQATKVVFNLKQYGKKNSYKNFTLSIYK